MTGLLLVALAGLVGLGTMAACADAVGPGGGAGAVSPAASPGASPGAAPAGGPATGAALGASPAASPGSVPGTGAGPAAPPAGVGTHLVVATWNVESFDRGGLRAEGSHEDVARVVKAAAVDVLVLQEIQDDDGDEARFARALAAEGWPMPHHRLTRMTDGFGAIGIFSRYPIGDVAEVLAPSGGNWPRTVLAARLELGGGLEIYGCHLKSGMDAASAARRLAQARALRELVQGRHPDNLSSARVIILGDMNTMTAGDTGPGGTLAWLQFRDDALAANDFWSANAALLPATNTIAGYRSVLDHIILSPALRLACETASVTVKRSDPEYDMVCLSDHYPVFLHLALPGN